MTPKVSAKQETLCDHCGAACPSDAPSAADKHFCCAGCKAVYELLHATRMGSYYDRADNPGLRPTEVETDRFAYLDNDDVRTRLVTYVDGEVVQVQLSVPQMHCVSCIWLLEHLERLDPSIVHSQVNFVRRQLTVRFDQSRLSIRRLVELLARLGYEPQIQLDSLDRTQGHNPNRSLYLKIGVAGFALGNIMLMAFPGYLGSDPSRDPFLTLLFSYASLALALPVLLYSANDYFRSAWRGVRMQTITIEFPLALGLAVLFGRSVYDIFTGLGPGYLDSFTGLVFLLLVGRVFQQRTYERLSFDRDYTAYFPVAVTRKNRDGQTSVPITDLKVGDRIVVRHQELVPADAVLISGEGHLDYSFVTGEAAPKNAVSGTMVYAGGRQTGGAIELEVVREVSQGYLTSLWNNEVFRTENRTPLSGLANRAGLWFTISVLVVAALSAIWWLSHDPGRAVNAVVAVLIVACPCALALCSPFALGTAQRIMGRHNLFLKNSTTVEKMASTDSIVFDKTGTLTDPGAPVIRFEGTTLTANERAMIASLASHSNHPTSKAIASNLAGGPTVAAAEFREESGRGISGVVDGHIIRIGRSDWAGIVQRSSDERESMQGTFITIDGGLRGKFLFSSAYRDGIAVGLGELKKQHDVTVLSGDNDSERSRLEALLGKDSNLIFDRSPHQKLEYIERLQQQGRRVLMVGDGLNDAGALKAAATGIAITENSSAFSPACDGILDARSLGRLAQFLQLARRTRSVILAGFAISVLYNVIGLYFAATGRLTPLVSAILMPSSSISVVLFASLATRLQAKRSGL
ncbi:heavy metal translocating P-type ATPase [candidate division GN15 bacterium]|uniref:Heavy metal translocating P-type ATPase n=1 Tax=candidate division GN15 bacterium TaxID=2072418 RepID=A0A855WTR5_9BACT|nr:MAG: heavy metal translocating P-type ATPase [candidate division GN15 bacterium]